MQEGKQSFFITFHIFLKFFSHTALRETKKEVSQDFESISAPRPAYRYPKRKIAAIRRYRKVRYPMMTEKKDRLQTRRAGSFPLRCCGLLLALLTLALLFTGCGGAAADPLAYQSYPMTVEGSISGDDGEAEVTVEMTAPMTAKLSFASPDSLRGYLFAITSDGVTLSYGDITVPYKADGIPGGTHLLPRLFSLTKETLISTEETEMNSLPLLLASFETEEGDTVKVYLDKQSGAPLRFEAQHGDEQIVFTVNSLTAADSGTDSGNSDGADSSAGGSDSASGEG